MSNIYLLLISIVLKTIPFVGVFSQTSQDLKLSIAKIEKSVRSIKTDSSLKTTVLHFRDIPSSTIKNFKTYRGPFNQLAAFYSNDSLRRLKIKTYSINSIETNYFFNNGQLIFIEEKYHNNSRMGSCGDIDIENRLYYNLEKLIKVETVETPFTCYKEQIMEKPLLTDLTHILTILKIYQAKQIR